MPKFKSTMEELLDFTARELIAEVEKLIEQEVVVHDPITTRGVLRDLVAAYDVRGELWRRIHLNLQKEGK